MCLSNGLFLLCVWVWEEEVLGQKRMISSLDYTIKYEQLSFCVIINYSYLKPNCLFPNCTSQGTNTVLKTWSFSSGIWERSRVSHTNTLSESSFLFFYSWCSGDFIWRWTDKRWAVVEDGAIKIDSGKKYAKDNKKRQMSRMFNRLRWRCISVSLIKDQFRHYWKISPISHQ